MLSVEVSIVTPLYNAATFIAQAIESVQSQTFKKWEMIIVDDCSTDDSAKIVKEMAADDVRIRLIRLDKNSGPAVARNRGIEEANGRYIAFLDSDDRWLPDKLQKQLAFMNEKGAVLSFSGYYIIDEESGERIKKIEVPQKVDYHELLKQNVIGCLTAIYDTKQVGRLYMPEIRKRQDFGLWLRILKMTPYAYAINEPLAEYRVRKRSLSSNKIKASLYNWKLYTEVEKLPWYKAAYYFGWYTYRSFLKYK